MTDPPQVACFLPAVMSDAQLPRKIRHCIVPKGHLFGQRQNVFNLALSLPHWLGTLFIARDREETFTETVAVAARSLMACRAQIAAAFVVVISSLVTGTAGQATNTTIYNPYSEGFGYVLGYDSLNSIYNAYKYGAPFSGMLRSPLLALEHYKSLRIDSSVCLRAALQVKNNNSLFYVSPKTRAQYSRSILEAVARWQYRFPAFSKCLASQSAEIYWLCSVCRQSAKR